MKFDRALNFLFQFLVLSYRTLGSLHLGGACRFHPTCSEYALQALKTHSTRTAIPMIFRRLGKCRPGGSFGLDPVPSIEEAH